MKESTKDRESDKFRAAQNNKSKVATTLEGDVGLLEGISYDDVQASYPNATTENYAYYLSAVLQATLEVTYTTASKTTFLRARRI